MGIEFYFAAQFRPIVSRCGRKRALVAVANSLLEAAYHMLKEKRHYQELGGDFFDGLNKEQIQHQLVQRQGKGLPAHPNGGRKVTAD